MIKSKHLYDNIYALYCDDDIIKKPYNHIVLFCNDNIDASTLYTLKNLYPRLLEHENFLYDSNIKLLTSDKSVNVKDVTQDNLYDRMLNIRCINNNKLKFNTAFRKTYTVVKDLISKNDYPTYVNIFLGNKPNAIIKTDFLEKLTKFDIHLTVIKNTEVIPEIDALKPNLTIKEYEDTTEMIDAVFELFDQCKKAWCGPLTDDCQPSDLSTDQLITCLTYPTNFLYPKTKDDLLNLIQLDYYLESFKKRCTKKQKNVLRTIQYDIVDYAYNIIVDKDIENIWPELWNHPISNKLLNLNETPVRHNRQNNLLVRIALRNLPNLLINDEVKCDTIAINSAKESLENTKSALTLTDWYEAMHDNDCMCITFNTVPKPLNVIGNRQIIMNGINDTFIPFTYFAGLRKEIILTSPIIRDRALGNVSYCLPVYICKEHWQISKKYYKAALSLAYSGGALYYQKVYQNLYYELLDYAFMNFNSENGYKLLFLLWRTCVQITFENKYQRGIYKYVQNIMDNPENTSFDIISIFMQILTSGFKFESINDLLAFLQLSAIPLVNKFNYYVAYNLFQSLTQKYGSFTKVYKKLDSSYGYDLEIINYTIEFNNKYKTGLEHDKFAIMIGIMN